MAEVSEELQSSTTCWRWVQTSSAETLSIAGKSLEDMREVVRAVDESVKGRGRESVRNEAVAVRGGEQLSAAVATMQEVEVAARRIAEIIGPIDQIAFQTNLLALNAAVEAAVPAKAAAALPWWRARCACWRAARPTRPRTFAI